MSIVQWRTWRIFKGNHAPTIEFLGHASDNEVVERFAHCKASVHAAEEDFGISMVESIAAGRPVVAYAVGGAADIIEPGLNGVLFQEPTVESLTSALVHCQNHQMGLRSYQTNEPQVQQIQIQTRALNIYGLGSLRSSARTPRVRIGWVHFQYPRSLLAFS